MGARDPPKITTKRQFGQTAFLGLLFASQRALSKPTLFPGLVARASSLRAGGEGIKAGVPVEHFLTQAPPPGSAQATLFGEAWKLCLMFMLTL